jgi:hypothetical protein
MATAAYFRMKARDCFDKATAADNQQDRMKWQQRGREFAEKAIAKDAETGKGAVDPDKLTTEERPRLGRNGVKPGPSEP